MRLWLTWVKMDPMTQSNYFYDAMSFPLQKSIEVLWFNDLNTLSIICIFLHSSETESDENEIEWSDEELSDGDTSWAQLARQYKCIQKQEVRKAERAARRAARAAALGEQMGDEESSTDSETACESDDDWDTESETEKESEGEGRFKFKHRNFRK